MRSIAPHKQHPKCILRLVGAYGPQSSEIPRQFTIPNSTFFDKKSEMESDQFPLKEIHSTFSGGFISIGNKGSVFAMGNNYDGEIGIALEYTESWTRPRFQIDPAKYQIRKLKWLKCGSNCSFAYVTCWSQQLKKEVNILCGTGNAGSGLLGYIHTSQSTRENIVKSFVPLEVPLKDGFDEEILGVESQGHSTLIWTRRVDGTNGIYGTGVNMSSEISSKEENLRTFTDLTKQFRNDFPSEKEYIIDIVKTLTTTQVLLSNGKLYARGKGRNCELGTGKLFEPHLSEVQIPYGPNEKVVKIAAGSHHCLALTSVKNPKTQKNIYRLFEWGAGNFPGKIIVGQSSDPNYTVPSPDRFPIREITNNYISYDDPITGIHCGSKMTYVTTESGKIYCAGDGVDGQFGVDPDHETSQLPQLGHFKNMTKYLVPPNEKIVNIATAQYSAILWTEEI